MLKVWLYFFLGTRCYSGLYWPWEQAEVIGVNHGPVVRGVAKEMLVTKQKWQGMFLTFQIWGNILENWSVSEQKIYMALIIHTYFP